MTLAQLNSKKAALVSRLQIAKNPVTAPDCSPVIRQQIINSNVQKYRRQITNLQKQIDIMQGRTQVNAPRRGFAGTLAEAF